MYMYLPLLIFEVYDIAQFYLVYPLLVFYNQAFSMKTVQLFDGLFEGLHQQAAFDRFLKEDKLPCRVVDLTPLGIVEVTRKKFNKPLKEMLDNIEL